VGEPPRVLDSSVKEYHFPRISFLPRHSVEEHDAESRLVSVETREERMGEEVSVSHMVTTDNDGVGSSLIC